MTTAIRRAAAPLAAIFLAAPLLVGCLGAEASQAAARLPAPAFDAPAAGPTETAVLSGGCFWGVQGVFAHVKGVKHVWAGYAGGQRATAEYEIVSTGTTGHAESVEVVFDPREISYGQILRIFFSVATDPTQINEQFPDQGTQYRSEIWYTTPEQKPGTVPSAADKARIFGIAVAATRPEHVDDQILVNESGTAN